MKATVIPHLKVYVCVLALSYKSDYTLHRLPECLLEASQVLEGLSMHNVITMFKVKGVALFDRALEDAFFFYLGAPFPLTWEIPSYDPQNDCFCFVVDRKQFKEAPSAKQDAENLVGECRHYVACGRIRSPFQSSFLYDIPILCERVAARQRLRAEHQTTTGTKKEIIIKARVERREISGGRRPCHGSPDRPATQ